MCSTDHGNCGTVEAAVYYLLAKTLHCLLLIYLSVLSPPVCILFPLFLSYSATPIDSAFLISQHNPINLIVIAAINI